MVPGLSINAAPSLLLHHTRRAMLAWLCREVRAAAHHFPQPRVFAVGEALTFLERRYPSLGVKKVGGSLGDLLNGRVPRRSLAVAYAADLVGYLDDELARAAVLALFRCLAPGGRLLLASFAWNLGNVEYANACRDWCMVARDARQMQILAEHVPKEEIDRIDQFPDSTGILCFTRLIRR